MKKGTDPKTKKTKIIAIQELMGSQREEISVAEKGDLAAFDKYGFLRSSLHPKSRGM
jgi:translation elongation factor EF-G